MKIRISKKIVLISILLAIVAFLIVFPVASTTLSKTSNGKSELSTVEDWTEKATNMTMDFEGIGHYGFSTAGSSNLRIKQTTSGYDVKVNFRDEDGDGLNEPHLAFQDFSLNLQSILYLYNKNISNGEYSFISANSTRAMASLQYVSSDAVGFVKENTGFEDIDNDSTITNITGSQLQFTGDVKYAILQTEAVTLYEDVDSARKIILISPKGNKFILSTDDTTRSSSVKYDTVEVPKADMEVALGELADRQGVLDEAGLSKTEFINRYIKEQHGHEKLSFDITDIVQQEGEGYYYVSIPALDYNNYSGSNSRCGVWSIVAIEENETKYPNLRYLALKTGYQVLEENKSLSMTIPSLLKTSSVSPKANVLVVANDGDPKIGTDTFKITSTTENNVNKVTMLSTDDRPENDFLNSTLDTVRNSAPKNSFELDIVDMDVSEYILPNSNLSITSSTTGESIGFRAIGIATDIFAPKMTITTSITDINGGEYLVNGEKVKCEVHIADVLREDSSINEDILSHDAVMIVKVPENTTYAGNLEVSYYSTSGPISAPSGTSVVYNEETNEIILTYPGSEFKIATVSFEAKVNDDVQDNTTLYLEPELTYHLVSEENANQTSQSYDTFKTSALATTNITTRKTGKVTVKYIDINTNEPLSNDDITEEVISTTYDIDKKEFADYTLLNGNDVPSSVSYQEEEQTITLYYAKNTSVVVNHIDKANNTILDTETIYGYVGKDYTSSNKSFEDYTYDTETAPTNGTGKMTEDQIVVIYYYNKDSECSVVTKYQDKITGEEIATSTIQTGVPGNPYTTTPKVIDNYTLETIPDNANGTMSGELTTVVYEYLMNATVTSKYIDKETGNELEAPNIYEGLEGKEYETEIKDIQYYNLIEVPSNASGKFEVDRTTNPYTTSKEVIYYYTPKVFDLAIDKKISSIIVNGEKQEIDNGKIEKIQIVDKNINDTNIVVEYTIVLKNIGEIEGKAKIVENIPSGFEFVSDDNEKYWTLEDGFLIATTENLQPGNTIELKVLLRWKNAESNLGTLSNVVNITDIENPANFVETNLEDNEDKCDIIIEIKKGAISILPYIISGILLVSGTLGIYIFTTKKKSSKY